MTLSSSEARMMAARGGRCKEAPGRPADHGGLPRHYTPFRPRYTDPPPAEAARSGSQIMSKIARLAVMAAATALAIPAHAQLITHRDLSAAMALTIARTAMDACTAKGYHVSVTVIGRNAEVIVQVRGDGASPHTVENSFRAYTSRTFRIPSGEMAKRFKDDPSYFAVRLSNVIPAEGALPIKVGDDVVGAVGVSGSPGGEKDAVCAQAGIDKVADELK